MLKLNSSCYVWDGWHSTSGQWVLVMGEDSGGGLWNASWYGRMSERQLMGLAQLEYHFALGDGGCWGRSGCTESVQVGWLQG